MEKISVCIPAHNEEKRIGKCVESVLLQRGVEITEILIGINASTDRSREIVEGCAKDDPRIRVVDSPKGKVNAWNALNAAAQNNLRVFQDGDCTSPPGAYLQLAQELKDNDIAGALIERDYKGKKLIPKILNFPRKYVFSIPVLNGGLYLMNYERIKRCLESKIGISIMPAGIINEDRFLQFVCDKLIVSQRAFVLTNIAETIQEEIMRFKRMSYGCAQLDREYSAVLGCDFENRPLRFKVVNLFQLFRLATLREKIVFPFIMPIRYILFSYIHLKAREAKTENDFVWK